jgi:hypothetical protein
MVSAISHYLPPILATYRGKNIMGNSTSVLFNEVNRFFAAALWQDKEAMYYQITAVGRAASGMNPVVGGEYPPITGVWDTILLSFDPIAIPMVIAICEEVIAFLSIGGHLSSNRYGMEDALLRLYDHMFKPSPCEP